MILSEEKIQAITATISADISYRNHLYSRDFKRNARSNQLVHLEALYEFADARVQELDEKIWGNLEKIVGDPEVFARTGTALPKPVVDELIRAWMFYSAMFSPDPLEVEK